MIVPSFLAWDDFIRTLRSTESERRKRAPCAKQNGRRRGRPRTSACAMTGALVTRGPACIHASAPGRLAQAHQPACRNLGFGARRRRAGPVLKIGNTGNQGLAAEQPREGADATV